MVWWGMLGIKRHTAIGPSCVMSRIFSRLPESCSGLEWDDFFPGLQGWCRKGVGDAADRKAFLLKSRASSCSVLEWDIFFKSHCIGYDI